MSREVMLKVGLIGWRGMVGSVLVQRMLEEGDFDSITPTFFTTSSVGAQAPFSGVSVLKNADLSLKDAYDIEQLNKQDVIISCQGGDYTKKIYPKLMGSGYKGKWVDAASTLRMHEDSCLILDPLNDEIIKSAVNSGLQTFVGANCTVSLLLLAIQGLIKEDLVEWVSSMTYQAASGGGAQCMKELLAQMYGLTQADIDSILDDKSSILDLDKKIQAKFSSADFPKENFQAALAGSLIPWIDTPCDEGNGQTREEWKAKVEANKILGFKDSQSISIDGTCVRIGAMRSHSQGLTIKLKKNVDLEIIENLIKNSHQWIEFVQNTPEQTREKLNPTYTSGTLKIAVGRVRKMNIGEDYLNLFTVGDQLLWGAAEPLRRVLKYFT